MAASMFRALERDALLVLCFSVFGAALLGAFLPDTFVGDSWMTLVAGREVIDHGIPSVDELTVSGEGRTWTNQQWLAHVIIYATERLGGTGLVALLSALCVLAAYAIALVTARRRGGSMRATLLIALPVIFAAPWTWTVRAQVLVLPLFAILLALLVDARNGIRRRTFWAVPLLVLWGNLHGAAALAAGLVTLVAIVHVVRRGSLLPAVGLAVLAWVALLVTPYAPSKTVAYYRLMLIDPPFADLLTEWQRPGVEWSTLAFGILVVVAAALVVRHLRRFSVVELALMAVTLVVALQAIRGLYWFSLVCLVVLPAVLGGRRLADRPGIPRIDRLIIVVSGAALVVAAVAGTLGAARKIDLLWPPRIADAVADTVETTGGPLYATSRHSDWLLWRVPSLRGRIAFDVRFEVYRRAQIERIVRFNGEAGDDWMSAVDGYRVVLLDRTRRPSHLADFVEDGTWRVAYIDGSVAVLARVGVGDR